MELVKVQLQQNNFYKGPIDCLRHMIRTRRCFTGLAPTVMRELSFGPYFVAYEVVTRSFMSDTSGLGVIFAGGLAGIAAWCSTYPADVIKTRIQTEPSQYRQGMMAAFKECYRKEGPSVFVRGLTPTLLRAFPSNAATFFAYTWTMDILSRNYEEAKVAAVL